MPSCETTACPTIWKTKTRMSVVSKLSCMVVDRGQFPYVALRLAREFGHVSYWSPDERAMPTLHEGVIGDGFEVQRVRSIWSEPADVYVFPDIGLSWEQRKLESEGHLVWGARAGDVLESNRGKFLRTLGELGLNVASHQTVRGMEALTRHLQDQEDKWVKISKWRGDWETLHWRNWELDHMELLARSIRLGPVGEWITFYVFDKLEIEVEDGVDTWNISGKWPSVVGHGMEKKDEFFIGTYGKLSDVPEEVRHVNEAIGPVLAKYGYRGAFSTEVCITKDKTPYFTDATCRFGSPPSQIQMEMVKNWGEIIWAGVNGECIDPELEFQFGIQGVLDLNVSPCEWATLRLPEELSRWLKGSFCGSLDGALIFPPAGEIIRAWLIGVGDTIPEAVDHFKANAELLPDGVSVNTQGLVALIEEIQQAEKMGMEFTPQPVPEPKEVVDA